MYPFSNIPLQKRDKRCSCFVFLPALQYTFIFFYINSFTSRCHTTLYNLTTFDYLTNIIRRSQCPRGLRRRSAAAHLLRSWVRIPPGARIFVCCEYCVLSGRGLCDELITPPEESYRMWCIVVCDLDNLKNEEAMTRVGSQRHQQKKNICETLPPNSKSL